MEPAAILGAMSETSGTRSEPSTTESAAERTVSDRWSDRDFTAELESIFWMASRHVRGHLNRRSSGRETCDWMTWFLGHYVAKRRLFGGGRRFLVLGCGSGWLERRIAEWPAAGAIDAQDVAEGAVHAAAAQARQLGLEQIGYQVGNLDRDSLPVREYDVVVAHSVIHHVERLEHALDQIARSLRRGGLLVLNEYVGPARLQYTDRQLELVNEVMARLPARYRRSAVMGEVYPHRDRPDRDYLVRVDPSESVRSDEILALVEERFDVLYRADLGGALLQPLLYDLVQNFDDDDPYDAALLRTLCALEGLLVDHGVLAPDYVFLVARPRGAPTPRSAQRSSGAKGRDGAAPLQPTAREAAIALPGWRSSVAGIQHANRMATRNPACDWVTWTARWLRDHGLRSEEEVLLLGDGWLRPALEHHLFRVEVVTEEQLYGSGAAWSERFGAVFTSGAAWSAGAGAQELLERLRGVLRRGGHLVANEYQGVTAEALGAAEALRRALDPAAAHLAVPSPERAPREVLGEIAAVFGRDGGALVQVLPCSGTVLEPLLDDVPPAILALRPAEAWASDDALLPLVCWAEERLVRDGVVAPSYAVAIARR
jgi:SAM-dependent methyltransferase